MDSRDVTVIMAARNAAATIEESIQGILAQTYPHFRLIVVDDLSTDSTRDIVRAHSDPRIELVALDKNVGPGAARNLAVRAARTELVANNDADDISQPERLERQVAYMETHPRCVLLGSAFEEMLDDGTPAGFYQPPCDPADVRWRLLFRNVIGNSTVMFRRDAALAAGGYDETLRYAEDYALWVALNGLGQAANLPDPLVRYRLNPSGLTAMQQNLDLAPAIVSQRAFESILGRPVSAEAVRCLHGVRPPRGARGRVARESARALSGALAGMMADGSAGPDEIPRLLANVRSKMRTLSSVSPASTAYIGAGLLWLTARAQARALTGRTRTPDGEGL